MAKIIAGRAETQQVADRAIAALADAGIGGSEVTSFYLNPPGQHSEYPLGGDAYKDEGARKSGKTAAAGATLGGVSGLALGTAVAAAAEPGFTAVAAVAGAGVGAYVGSLAGGLSGARTGDPDRATEELPVEREAGVMVAVRTDAAGVDERKVVDALRNSGVRDIERAEGEWRDGAWADFDPRCPPQLIG